MHSAHNCLSTSLLHILDMPLNMNIIVMCSARQENMLVTVRAKSMLYACQSIDIRGGKMDWKRPYTVYDKLLLNPRHGGIGIFSTFLCTFCELLTALLESHYPQHI